MKMMLCPLNGLRNISEFVCAGEVVEMPDPVTGTDREWSEYTFLENNTRGVVREWWMHVATSYWFIAERDTMSDEVVRTYPATELFNTRVDFQQKPASD